MFPKEGENSLNVTIRMRRNKNMVVHWGWGAVHATVRMLRGMSTLMALQWPACWVPSGVTTNSLLYINAVFPGTFSLYFLSFFFFFSLYFLSGTMGSSREWISMLSVYIPLHSPLQPPQEDFHQQSNVTLSLPESWCCRHQVQVGKCSVDFLNLPLANTFCLRNVM